MNDWNTKSLPDFTVHGFHLGWKIGFRLDDGTEHEGIYHGWGVFGANGVDYQNVVAWRPVRQEQE